MAALIRGAIVDVSTASPGTRNRRPSQLLLLCSGVLLVGGAHAAPIVFPRGTVFAFAANFFFSIGDAINRHIAHRWDERTPVGNVVVSKQRYL